MSPTSWPDLRFIDGSTTTMDQSALKQQVAKHAIKRLKAHSEDNLILGVGTGSTTECFIRALPSVRDRIGLTVSSSERSTALLESLGFTVVDLNALAQVHVYIDGADETNARLELIKGGGAALTREKIIAAVANQFICIADSSKRVDVLGDFPLPVEIIPMAKSHVARQLVKLGGQPVWREGVITDNGNFILDVHDMHIDTPLEIERAINEITGVVCNGLFAIRPADELLLGTPDGVVSITR